MKGASDYEDQGDLKNPVNQVVAILSHEADPAKVIADLHAARFASRTSESYPAGKTRIS
jgi:hypothetical protein